MADRRGLPRLSGPMVLVAIASMLPVGWVFAFLSPFFYPPLVLACSGAFADPQERGRMRVLKGLLAMVVLPAFAAALLAPGRLVAHGLHHAFPSIPLDLFSFKLDPDMYPPFFIPLWQKMQTRYLFDWWLGGCGVAVFVIGAFVSWFRNLRVIRQIENLPTSKARSAALGLAEFRGVAWPVSTPSAQPILFWNIRRPGREVLNRFYLEDDTGHILVDPKGAEFSHGAFRFLYSVRSILLTPRVEHGVPGMVSRLMPGDRVYVIGSVEENRGASRDAADADRLVVRPSSDWVKPNLLQLLGPTTGSKVPGGDIHHVFFLSDTSERTAADLVREATWRTWYAASAGAAMSAALLWVVSGKC